MFFKNLFNFILAFVLGSFLHDLLTTTHKLAWINYVIPFQYQIELYWVLIILIMTTTFLRLNNYRIIKVLYMEMLLFSFILGTIGIEGIVNMKWNKEMAGLIGVIVVLLSFYYEKYGDAPDNEPSEKIYESRISTMEVLDKYLRVNDVVGLNGKWGVGKTCFLKNFIFEKRESYIPVYIDTSIYSDTFKIIQKISSDIDIILRKNKINPIGLNSLKKILKEYNLITNYVLSMLDDDSIEENKRKLKEAIKKIKKKKIIICLDNIERIHAEKKSKVIELLALIEETFKGSGIKIVLCYEKKYFIKNLQIDELYLSKYIEIELELKDINYEEVLNELKDRDFKKECTKILTNFFKVKEEYEERDRKLSISLEKEEAVRNKQKIKEILNRIDIFFKDINNPREIKKIFEYWSTIEKDKLSSQTIIWYKILEKYFNDIDINIVISSETYLIDSKSLERYLNSVIFLEAKYLYEKLKIEKEFDILKRNKITSSEEEVEKEFDEDAKEINSWDIETLLKKFGNLDSILTKERALKKIEEIKPKLESKILLLKDNKEFESLLRLSFYKEVVLDIFNSNIKIGENLTIRLEKHCDEEFVKCYLALRALENEMWIQVILRRKLKMEDNEFRFKKNLIDILSRIEVENVDEKNCVDIFFKILKKKTEEYFTENKKYLKFKDEVIEAIKVSELIYGCKINKIEEKYIEKNDIILNKLGIISYKHPLKIIMIDKKEGKREIDTIEGAQKLKGELDILVDEFINNEEFESDYISTIEMFKLEINNFIRDKQGEN
ncbi:P-loop NTPase fold protein [Cetobacterium sp.]|uniref:P-loop NTPase fold protein n=1 Tax=Cetobacterium sp. TaxID=2071632 RepID=UPI003EE57B9C